MWSVLDLSRTKDCKEGAHQFCVICMEDPDAKESEISKLKCGHIFCTECIDQLISFATDSAKCPLCRKSLVKMWSIRKICCELETLGTKSMISITVICCLLAAFMAKYICLDTFCERWLYGSL